MQRSTRSGPSMRCRTYNTEMASRENVERLLADRPRFVSFVSARIGDRATAEDLVQSAAVQALSDAHDLGGLELSRWFYRVLRNAIIDRHRRFAAEGRALERYQSDPATHIDVVAPTKRLCRCVTRALAALEPTLRSAIEAIEVRGHKPAQFAHEAGISSGNAAVRVHRARRKLAEQLKAICGTCTLDSCSDCDCGRSRQL